jgi:hypothetical protein
VGIEWPGLVTGVLQERTEGASYHRVGAEDGYSWGLGVVFHFGWLLVLETFSQVFALDAERAGALCPDPPWLWCALPPLVT